MDLMQDLKANVRAALDEDIGSGDVTANLIPESTQAKATVLTREPAVICGQPWFNEVFHQLDPAVQIEWLVEEGSHQPANTLICHLAGPARSLLAGERTALNFLQLLSGTATTTRQYVDAIAGLKTRVLDTRKTIPGLRLAQKYAVATGGGKNHRIGLFDQVLIKENHIIAAGSISAAVAQARQQYPELLVEVETETLSEFEEALATKADIIMLDNFSLEDMRTAVQRNAGSKKLEASGNVTLKTIRSIAETGVDYISSGALTKDVKSIDLSMRFELRQSVAGQRHAT